MKCFKSQVFIQFDVVHIYCSLFLLSINKVKSRPFPIRLDARALAMPKKQIGAEKDVHLTDIQMVRYIFNPQYYMFSPFPQIIVFEHPKGGSEEWVMDQVDAHG